MEQVGIWIVVAGFMLTVTITRPYTGDLCQNHWRLSLITIFQSLMIFAAILFAGYITILQSGSIEGIDLDMIFFLPLLAIDMYLLFTAAMDAWKLYEEQEIQQVQDAK
jgi:hypothetical protein